VAATKLSGRKIKGGVMFVVCGKTEFLVHHFWTCPHLASAWSCLVEQKGIKHASPVQKKLRCHAELKKWLLDWTGKAHVDQVTWFVLMVTSYGYHQTMRGSQELWKIPTKF
jgi:hypothetical protein